MSRKNFKTPRFERSSSRKETRKKEIEDALEEHASTSVDTASEMRVALEAMKKNLYPSCTIHVPTQVGRELSQTISYIYMTI